VSIEGGATDSQRWRHLIRGLIAALVLAVVAHFGARRVGPLPPLGPLLNPWTGALSAARQAELPAFHTLAVPGLDAPVEVRYDDRGVPHIFAGSVEDVALAFGYVTARDRLFQLELRWRAAAGRLSELVGSDALGYDRYIRELGLAWSAERDFAAEDPGSSVRRVLDAYARGVNGWIDRLGRGDYPLEYRLLGVGPSPWEPVYSLYLIKHMGWDLTYGVQADLERLRVMGKVGKDAADALLPVNSPIQQPIEPNGRTTARYDFASIPPPGRPDSVAAWLADHLRGALGYGLARAGVGPDAVRGSNNWTVSAERTAAGYALLAGDPHLELTLPSIWYEAHLVVPGELDVYGVTIPSVPAIIIGFNRDVAWSLTNTGADVIDYYVEELDHPDDPRRYRVDGVWRELERRVETYYGRGGALLATDTLKVTHRGPLLEHRGRHLSMRWTVLEGSGATQEMLQASQAKTVAGYMRAIDGFTTPAQNMAVADRYGTIGIRSTGHYPLQPDGDGRVVRDGTRSASDWIGFWPVDRYPGAVNPVQGYLASANQQPIDPRVDSTYLGADWPSPWRAIRINQLLAANDSVTPDDMRHYQTDPGNARADHFVPYLVAAAGSGSARDTAGEPAAVAARLLSDWDRLYTRENERAVLFELAMDELEDRLWDELLDEPTDAEQARRVFTPASAVTASLLRHPTSPWWDDRRTPEAVEGRDDILVASLAAAYAEALERHGEPAGGGWRWDRIRHANIYHLLNIESLSALELPIQGGPGSLNPSSGRGTHGASWRMVVELGPEVRAWSIYPGGQSGNPASRRYDDRIDAWVNGELEPVLFPRSPDELPADRVMSRLTLEPGGER
jgi:penicillin amidase